MSRAFYYAWCLTCFVLAFSWEIDRGSIIPFIITYILFAIWVAAEVRRAVRRM